MFFDSSGSALATSATILSIASATYSALCCLVRFSYCLTLMAYAGSIVRRTVMNNANCVRDFMLNGSPCSLRFRWPDLSQPHPLRELFFFGPGCVGVNRRGGKPGMAQPLLSHVEGNVRRDGLDAETVPKTLGRGVPSGDAGDLHHFRHAPPGRRARPCPQPDALVPAALARQRFNTVNEAESFEKIG